MTADIANLGTDDQSDAYIKLTNTQLGLDKKISINNLNSLETDSIDYTFTIPENAEEGTYSIGVVVYNYRNNVYTTDFSSKESRFIVPLQISGGCALVPLASVSAKLDHEAKSGQELTVKATITNTDSKMSTFNLDLSDYSQWASLVSMDRNFVTLNVGESQEVVIKLKANSDATGENKFNINLKQGSKILSQPVLVTIKNGFSFPDITGFFLKVSGGNNFYLWGIGALNIILILVIFVVASKVIKKK
ncbi:MAG: putative S-layer protein [Nanoarchaeota archaeon]